MRITIPYALYYSPVLPLACYAYVGDFGGVHCIRGAWCRGEGDGMNIRTIHCGLLQLQNYLGTEMDKAPTVELARFYAQHRAILNEVNSLLVALLPFAKQEKEGKP